jgi:hypothetical protein
MKYIILLLALLPLTLSAQLEAKQSEFTAYSVDTLSATDTVIIEFLHANGRGVDFKQTYDYTWIITADSLSGANDGTIYLQYSNTPYGVANPVWYNAETTVINGTTRQTIYYTGTLLTRRSRIYYLTPAGAKSIRVNTQGIAKRKNYK